MAFGIPNNIIPAIAGLANVSSLVPKVGGMGPRASSVVTALTTDARDAIFSNPMATGVASVTGSITSVTTTLTSIATGAVSNPGISAGDATTFLAGGGLADLAGGLAAFKLHTDRLSGVLKGTGISTPGLEQLSSIGAQMNNMANLLDGSKGCLNVIGSATGLFSGDALTGSSGAVGTLNNIVSQINRGVLTIADVSSTVLSVKNTIAAIVDKDTNFLGQCVEQLKSAAFGMLLSAAMNDPCMKFIVERTGTPAFMSKLALPVRPTVGGR